MMSYDECQLKFRDSPRHVAEQQQPGQRGKNTPHSSPTTISTTASAVRGQLTIA